MNERIQELINECTTISDDMVYDGESWHMETYEYFDKEKFAELIVRECADVMINDPRLSDVRSATRGCARSIKEHFGVEE